jgi:methyl-accepting chemotaxis protein
MDVAVLRMPVYAESAAKLRGSMAALVAKKEVGPDDIGVARQLIGEMDMLLEIASEGLAKAIQRVPALKEQIERHQSSLLAAHAAIKASVIEKVLEGKADMTPAAYFEFATAPVALSQTLASESAAELQKLLQARAARLVRERNLSLGACAGVILLVLYLAGAAFLGMRASVRALVSGGARLAEGDLEAQVMVGSRDEFAQVAASFNAVGASLRGVIADVSRGANELSRSAGTLSAMTAQVATASTAQNDAAASMAAGIEELTVSISHVAASSNDALKASKQAGALSQAGNHAVQGAAAEMDGIAGAAQDFASIIDRLGQESTQISRIVGVIEAIAGQTNLLALNAAIEAARAGEQGRGFAVVADEVRKLAERTAQSTQEVVGMVAGIQEGTRQAVERVDAWKTAIGSGVEKARGAGARMREIEAGTGDVVAAVNEISAALAEQSTASSDMARNVESIARMSDENHRAIGSVAGEAGQLEQLAVMLNSLVGHFKLRTAGAA